MTSFISTITEADRVSGGVAAHPQHPRHEDPAHNPGHASQPSRTVRAVPLRREMSRGVPRIERGGGGADLRRRPPERQVRDRSPRQSPGRPGLVHVRETPRHRLRARDGDSRIRGARAHATLRVPTWREALRVHSLPGLQRLRGVPGGHLQHGDRARVPAEGGRTAAARRGRGRAARRLDGLAVTGGVARRHLPAAAVHGRADSGPSVRRGSSPAARAPRRGRRHELGTRPAAGGGHGGRGRVRLRSGRGRGRRVSAATHPPPAGALSLRHRRYVSCRVVWRRVVSCRPCAHARLLVSPRLTSPLVSVSDP